MKEFSILKYYLQMFRKYAVFSGRADRAEFWLAIVTHYLIITIGGTASGILNSIATISALDQNASSPAAVLIQLLVFLYSLAACIPLTAICVRRLHDVNRSGWWILISYTGIGTIVLLIWLVQQGTEDTNLFGSDPHPIRQY